MPSTLYVVDDSKTVRLMLRTILAYEGFSVKDFVNGESVLAACAAALPDLVVLDVLMPGMDGYEVCRQLRALSPSLPIIMLTTRAEPAERERGAAAGATDYVIKPFDTPDLVRRVRHALGADV